MGKPALGSNAWIVAAAFPLLAAGLSFALAPILEGALFPFFFLAVALAAWIGGRGPALLALLLGGLLAGLLSVRLNGRGPADFLGPLAAFGVAGLGTAELIVQQQRRRLAESRAATSGAEVNRLRQVVECSAAPIAVIELGSRHVTLLNRAGESLSGFGQDEVLGRPLALLERATIDALIEETLATGSASRETELLQKDGGRIPVAVIAYPVRDERGAITELAGVALDIRQQRAAWLEAQAAIRLRDEFLSIASHELLTPLTPLQTRMQMLRRQVEEAKAGGPLDLPRTHALLEACEAQLKRFAALVRTLLDASQLAEGRMELEREPVDFAALVREGVARFSVEARRAGSEIRLAEAPVAGSWDRARLEQLVDILLSNAIKYGGGAPIDVELGVTAESAFLVVRDRGLGVAAEDRQRIFGRFERAVSARHFGGLGLGLYLARQIASAHGGSIQAEETGEGRGAAFRVELPLAG